MSAALAANAGSSLSHQDSARKGRSCAASFSGGGTSKGSRPRIGLRSLDKDIITSHRPGGSDDRSIFVLIGVYSRRPPCAPLSNHPPAGESLSRLPGVVVPLLLAPLFRRRGPPSFSDSRSTSYLRSHLTWDYLRLMSTPRNKRKSAARESAFTVRTGSWSCAQPGLQGQRTAV
jgi:hypothetical protein